MIIMKIIAAQSYAAELCQQEQYHFPSHNNSCTCLPVGKFVAKEYYET